MTDENGPSQDGPEEGRGELRLTLTATLQDKKRFLETLRGSPGLLEELSADPERATGFLTDHGIFPEPQTSTVRPIEPFPDQEAFAEALDLLEEEAENFLDDTRGRAVGRDEYGVLWLEINSEPVAYRHSLGFAMPFVPVDDGDE